MTAYIKTLHTTPDGFRVCRTLERDIPESPREWTIDTTMYCSHTQYDLGDVELNASDPEEDFLATLLACYPDELPENAWDIVTNQNTILPLYLYDHSGITMRTSPFSCPWDSGQVGWIVYPHTNAKATFGWKRVTTKRRTLLEERLKAEVAVYDQYLTGDVWNYFIESPTGEFIDSLGCVYPDRPDPEKTDREYLQEAFNTIETYKEETLLNTYLMAR